MSYPRRNLLRKSSGTETNKAAKVELPEAGHQGRYVLERVIYGYGGKGTFAEGTLTIEDGIEPAQIFPIAAKGVQWLPLEYQAKATAEVKVTLSAGGSEVTGIVTLIYAYEG